MDSTELVDVLNPCFVYLTSFTDIDKTENDSWISREFRSPGDDMHILSKLPLHPSYEKNWYL